MLTVGEKTYRYAAMGVLALMFALVLRTFLDYGVTWDEELQSQYGRRWRIITHRDQGSALRGNF